ncbi:hypothetical protein ACOME3_006529 [Neoechinorhynchus agilis]
MGADIGLFLRTDKCEIISDDQEDASRLLTVLPGAKTTATDSADILGSPIGNLSNLGNVSFKSHRSIAAHCLQALAHRATRRSVHTRTMSVASEDCVPSEDFSMLQVWGGCGVAGERGSFRSIQRNSGGVCDWYRN